MGFHLAVDVGGTFTDVVGSDESGRIWFGKALTDTSRAYAGIEGAIGDICNQAGLELRDLLANCDVLLYGTTRATNAIVESRTARTAMIVTRGFRDILSLREGGKLEPFNYGMTYPDPYVPRSLTWEIDERTSSDASILRPLDEQSVKEALTSALQEGIEAIGVCLLWSMLNPTHELRVGTLIKEIAGEVMPFTLSHSLNPIVREYRRASSTAIDASLKPLMQKHLRVLEDDLMEAGFRGSLLVATSFGGAWQVADAVEKPIYMVGSGPSMAPRAAVHLAERELEIEPQRDMVICDVGGTTFDVSVVSEGLISRTSEAWLGDKFTGHMLGISCVNVRSLGAGGGSIAWVDPGRLLRVGPRSSGARPGPVAYGLGGTEPTMTDAAVALGYIAHGYFFGGRLDLQVEAARDAIAQRVAKPLELSVEAAAAGILRVASELMVAAIKDVTVNQGIDPRKANLVAGGGAAGLNILPIAAELECPSVIVPRAAGVLSAYGGHYSDIVTEIRRTFYQESTQLHFEATNRVLSQLEAEMDDFGERLPVRPASIRKEFLVEARYSHQLWELAVPLPSERITARAEVVQIVNAFHDLHERYYAVREGTDRIEFLTWVGRVTVDYGHPAPEGHGSEPLSGKKAPTIGEWPAYFEGHSFLTTPRFDGRILEPGQEIHGPSLILEPTTTLVVYPEWVARVSRASNYLLTRL